MQINRVRNLTFLIIFLVIVFLPLSYSYAQNIDLGSLTLSKSAQNPTPGQTVKITLTNYEIDLDAATEVWKVDGIEVKRGIGLKSFDTTSPSVGKVKVVSATAVTQDGRVFIGELTLDSGSIDIIFESGGYTPPFFAGKVPIVYQNTFKMIAVPHIYDSAGKEVDPSTLIYTWYKNASVVADASGYGKNSLTLTGSPIPSPLIMKVTVKTRDGRYEVSASKTVSYTDPFIKFYANDPLYGPLFNLQIPNIKYLTNQNEFGLLAVPYGFDKPINDVGNLILNWTIDGSLRKTLSANENIIVRAPEGTSGTSNISLEAYSFSKNLQKSESSFSILFKQRATTNDNSVSF